MAARVRAQNAIGESAAIPGPWSAARNCATPGYGIGGAGLALWYLIGKDRGWGGGGRSSGEPGGRHCSLRLSSTGLTRDGESTTAIEAAEWCRGGTAEVLVTGDATMGELEDLHSALEAAGVRVVEVGRSRT